MSTKKKLSFNVPTGIDSGRDSGWVYRSPVEKEAEKEVEPDRGAVDASSLSLALTAMVQVTTLGMAIATIPLTIGMRVLGLFVPSGDARNRR
jgi:hypothetical protein